MSLAGTPHSVVETRNAALLDWYAANRRALPWRSTTDPYRILVAEVMSHQTQIERVVPAYERFLDRFPTIDDLASAPLRDVMEVWSGLGYNNRARRLHETARTVSASGWPDTVAGLLELPGVGPYTAHAVAAFAMGRRLPAIDTNLRRVLSRWYGEELSGPALRAAADEAVAHDASSWNQAVMDLGAVVCTPRKPRCGRCPVTDHCAGPDVYVPPRPQPRFEGSTRQLRGAIVRTLIGGPAGIGELRSHLRADPESLEMAVDGLIDDGIVVAIDDDRVRLAD